MSDNKDLLIEIGTEELPPKALANLSLHFTKGVVDALTQAGLGMGEVQSFAAPRRLGVLIRELEATQAAKTVQRRGPAVQAAFKPDGTATPAATGFAASCGVTVDQLQRMETDKGAWLFHESVEAGQPTETLIAAIVEQSLAKLPIPKRMRWGAGNAEFVRPVHWIVMLFGDDVIDEKVMEVQAGRVSCGHRFHHPEEVTIASAANYADVLRRAHVVADFAERRAQIRQQVAAAAASLNATVLVDEDLLDEVTALVEWPVTLVGNFEARFLSVPQEALISTMKDNQKYFPVVNSEGVLQPHFITVSNIESLDPQKVIEGNERVVRPRLSDAAFFWDQDRKSPLESRLEKLHDITFQAKLGTLFDKTARVKPLAASIAGLIGADETQAARAATLAKCDLMTDMVFEFPEMQGIAGRYYAMHDGEADAVAKAIEQQYLPKQAGDSLPVGGVAQALALAEKLDTLQAIFGIGQKPTGTKDPFALRRQALGVLRIIIEGALDLDLRELLQQAAVQLGDKLEDPTAIDGCFDYVLERLKAYYQDQGFSADVIDAVMVQRPSRPLDFDKRVRAVAAFKALPESEALAAANKRIQNILKKSEGSVLTEVESGLLQEDAERALYDQTVALVDAANDLFEQGQYEQALCGLAVLRAPVDAFFDQVMVNADDEALKKNRLALLNQLSNLFLRAADLSRLQ